MSAPVLQNLAGVLNVASDGSDAGSLPKKPRLHPDRWANAAMFFKQSREGHTEVVLPNKLYLTSAAAFAAGMSVACVCTHAAAAMLDMPTPTVAAQALLFMILAPGHG